ncbi:hypothetical protein ZWY2020_042924 [Hordeum vulgare]|nr:hypothetical protein ZWY2020_042924 [Hordeum vulgare]
MFPMYQHLVPKNFVDKCGHHYTICLDLNHQLFNVLDSFRSGDDTNLTSHAKFFVRNLQETWNRHYESSGTTYATPFSVHLTTMILSFIECFLFCCRYDCGYYMLEYLTKWEGRKVRANLKAIVVELRKILTWNWVKNGDFNKRNLAQDFIDEVVKTACKKYK